MVENNLQRQLLHDMWHFNGFGDSFPTLLCTVALLAPSSHVTDSSQRRLAVNKGEQALKRAASIILFEKITYSPVPAAAILRREPLQWTQS
ncbi:hypothetical protein KSP40_PGU022692 [Platanthera guangdongensis]|uniref:Uncharacterized protein n=1 Tax=Platanthera guangdongensis TaxID=2320717 RepID=A0ABR2N088_9ASPA